MDSKMSFKFINIDMSEPELNPLDLARATIGFAGTPIKVKISGNIHEFVRSFYLDRDGNNDAIHGEFQFNRHDSWEEGVYEVGLPPLSPYTIKREGWLTSSQKSYINGRFLFEKGNYFLVLDITKKVPHIEIGAKDLLLVNFMERQPERFAVTIPCPTIADFRYIMKLLKI